MKKISALMPLVLPLIGGCTGVESTSTKSNPNIIFIFADDMGYGDVKACNPEGKIETKHLDAMAENGVLFTDAHTTSAVSTPSRYGVLTGRYNWRSSMKGGVLSGFSRGLIAPDRSTVASMLAESGYNTGYIGKWHLGWDWSFAEGVDLSKINNLEYNAPVNYDKPVTNSPADHGFGYYYGFCGSLDMAPYVWVENDRVVSPPDRMTVNVDAKGFWRYGDTAPDFHHTTVLQDVTDKAVEFISKNSKSDSPYFLYLPLPAPHTPILPTTEFLGASNTNMYGDFVLQVDDVVGQIRAAVEASGEGANTIVVFSSDNGCSPRANFTELENVGHSPSANRRGMKADLYEGGHRVPLIIEWGAANNSFKRNSKFEKTVCLTDFYATCADIVGYELKDTEAEDSFSLLSALEGDAQDFARQHTVHHSINGAFALRSGDWKLIFSAGSAGWSYPTDGQIRSEKLDLPSLQLFNMKEDPKETVNLVEQNPEVVKSMILTMAELIRSGRSNAGEKVANDPAEKWLQADAILKMADELL